MFIWRKVGPAKGVALPSKNGVLARRVTFLVAPTELFVSPFNGSPHFLRK